MAWFLQTSSTSPLTEFNSLYDSSLMKLGERRRNPNPIHVEAQVPFWMIKNSDGDGNRSLMIPFLQHYYEWLSNYYGYETVSVFDITSMMDISSTPSFLLPTYLRSYAPDLVCIFDLPDENQPTSENIKNTVINIKNEIYQRKSTEQSFKNLLSSLLSIDSSKISFSYPGDTVLSLNGTALLNGNSIQDDILQPFTYIVTTNVDDNNVFYECAVRQALHPAGYRGYFETYVPYEEEGGDEESDAADFEVPLISNYYPYTLGSSISLDKCTGCTGALSKPGWEYPTFVYPSWDKTIVLAGPSANFGSIVVSEMFGLEGFEGRLSPNDAIGTTCEFACNINGDALLDWAVGIGLLPPSINVSENEQEAIYIGKDPTIVLELPTEET